MVIMFGGLHSEPPRPPDGLVCVAQFEEMLPAVICRDTLAAEGISARLEDGQSSVWVAGQSFVIWAPEAEAARAVEIVREFLAAAGEDTALGGDPDDPPVQAAICDDWEDAVRLRAHLRISGIGAEIEDYPDTEHPFALHVDADNLHRAQACIAAFMETDMPESGAVDEACPPECGACAQSPAEMDPSMECPAHCPNCQGARVQSLAASRTGLIGGLIAIVLFVFSVLVPSGPSTHHSRWYCPDCGWEW